MSLKLLSGDPLELYLYLLYGGAPSSYSTVSPSTSHALVAKCAAEDLLNRILK